MRAKLIILFVNFIGILLIIQISACCIGKDDSADLVQTAQEFPANVNTNETFTLRFTVQNQSTGDCSANRTNDGTVQLKMVNRATPNEFQVNDFQNLNPLDNNATQVFTFTVNIGTAGTYDLTFIIDVNNSTGAVNSENNVYTSTVIVN